MSKGNTGPNPIPTEDNGMVSTDFSGLWMEL